MSETGKATGAGMPATQQNLGEMGAMGALASMYQTFAVVAALMQRDLIDPETVAAWADAFAAMQTAETPALIRSGVCDQMRHFVTLLRGMTKGIDASTATKQ